MDRKEELLCEELIDLGSVTAETHGVNGDMQPDLPQPRQEIGILND